MRQLSLFIACRGLPLLLTLDTRTSITNHHHSKPRDMVSEHICTLLCIEHANKFNFGYPHCRTFTISSSHFPRLWRRGGWLSASVCRLPTTTTHHLGWSGLLNELHKCLDTISININSLIIYMLYTCYVLL